MLPLGRRRRIRETADGITTRVVCRMPGGPPIRAQLRYTSRRPFEVTATFTNHGQVEHWVLARALLVDGLTGPTGIGNVKIRPANLCRHLVVSLTGDDDGHWITVDLHFPVDPVRRFVDRCLELVPRCAHVQDVDLDGELAAMIGGHP